MYIYIYIKDNALVLVCGLVLVQPGKGAIDGGRGQIPTYIYPHIYLHLYISTYVCRYIYIY